MRVGAVEVFEVAEARARMRGTAHMLCVLPRRFMELRRKGDREGGGTL